MALTPPPILHTVNNQQLSNDITKLDNFSVALLKGGSVCYVVIQKDFDLSVNTHCEDKQILTVSSCHVRLHKNEKNSFCPYPKKQTDVSVYVS